MLVPLRLQRRDGPSRPNPVTGGSGEKGGVEGIKKTKNKFIPLVKRDRSQYADVSKANSILYHLFI